MPRKDGRWLFSPRCRIRPNDHSKHAILIIRIYYTCIKISLTEKLWFFLSRTLTLSYFYLPDIITIWTNFEEYFIAQIIGLIERRVFGLIALEKRKTRNGWTLKQLHTFTHSQIKWIRLIKFLERFSLNQILKETFTRKIQNIKYFDFRQITLQW